MVLLKIAFKGKNILLGRGITCFEEIEKQLEARFPGQLASGIMVKYEGIILKDMQQLNIFVPDLAQKSIKLEIEVVSKDFKKNVKVSQDEVAFKQEFEMNELIMKEQQLEKKEEEKEVKDIYLCFYCEKKDPNCKICDGLGRFREDSKYIKFIDEIVKERTKKQLNQPLISAIKVENIQKKEEKQKKNMNKVIEWSQNTTFTLQNFKSKNLFNVEEPIIMSYKLNTKSQIKLGSIVFIVDQETNEKKQIIFNDGNIFTVGPYLPKKNQTTLSKSFRLMAYDPMEGKSVFFGSKFGFNVQIMKIKQKVVLSNDFRKYIEELKIVWDVQKGTEYIVEKMKEVGINRKNYRQMDEFIEDIIRNL